MKKIIVLSVIVVVFSGNAFGGQDHDICLKQEQELRSKELSRCSGLQQLFNPSDCFATRKALKEFNAGKCAKTGRPESVAKSPSAPKSASEPIKNVSELKNEVPSQPEMKVKQVVPERIIAPMSANPELDACRKQEKEVRAKEADQCSGIKYTFNPSGCFSARKILKEYDEGKCRKNEAADKGVLKEQSVKIIPATKPVAVINNSPETVQPATNPLKAPNADTSLKQTVEAEKLREENARVKAENERLRAEMEQLRRSINK